MQFGQLKRRDFITVLGGAAAWPFAARAQQPAMPVVGFLNSASPDVSADRLRAFHQGLKDTGFVEGENVAIAYRWAENQFDRLPELAAELVRQQVKVIAVNLVAAFPAKAATASIPIVFVTNEDPVRAGLVASLARPGGNLTGINVISGELTAKRLELLRELVPSVARVAVLVDPAGRTTETTLRDVEPAARGMGCKSMSSTPAPVARSMRPSATFVDRRPDALFVAAELFFTSRRVQLATSAARHGIPMTCATREITEVGGLMSYGSNLVDAYRQVGVSVGRILRGTGPSELPVIQSNKFELVINAQTARILGLEVPPMLLARADDVIE